jgi:hypothetical protein
MRTEMSSGACDRKTDRTRFLTFPNIDVETPHDLTCRSEVASGFQVHMSITWQLQFTVYRLHRQYL